MATHQSAQELAKMLIDAWCKNPHGGTLTVGHPIPSPATPAPSHDGKAPRDEGNGVEARDDGKLGDGKGDDGKAGDDGKGDDGKAGDDGKGDDGKGDDGKGDDGKGDDGKGDGGKGDGGKGDDGKEGEKDKALGGGVASSCALALPAPTADPSNNMVSPTYVPDTDMEEEAEHVDDQQAEKEGEEPSDVETVPGCPEVPLDKKTIKQYTEGSLVLTFLYFSHREII